MEFKNTTSPDTASLNPPACDLVAENTEHQLVVQPAEAGQRLDQYLVTRLPGYSRAQWQRQITEGEVLVNERVIKSSHRVQSQEVVTVELPTAPLTNLVAEARSLDIVYEDAAILVVNKPAGLVVHPAAGIERGTLANALVGYFQPELLAGSQLTPASTDRDPAPETALPVAAQLLSLAPPSTLAERSISLTTTDEIVSPITIATAEACPANAPNVLASPAVDQLETTLATVAAPTTAAVTIDSILPLTLKSAELDCLPPAQRRPGIVHRLDRDTSGLLVVAKTETAYQHLAAQFAARTVEKRYLALVYGRLDTTSGVIDLPIGRHKTQRTKMCVAPGWGRAAYTRYRVVQRWQDFSLLEVEIKTGRTHQIRVHLAHQGHPVVADEVYGAGRFHHLKSALLQKLIRNLGRHWLHAQFLALQHPTTSARLQFHAPVPTNLTDLLAHLT